MTTQLVFDRDAVFAFVRERMSMSAVEGMQGIGLARDGALVAGVIYEGFNGVNVWMHVAAMPGARWLTRRYLSACFRFPFVQLGCQRVSGYVEASNAAARRFDEHLGFKQEALLHGAARDGRDVIIYRMLRGECRHA